MEQYIYEWIGTEGFNSDFGVVRRGQTLEWSQELIDSLMEKGVVKKVVKKIENKHKPKKES